MCAEPCATLLHMILSSSSIEQAIAHGEIGITPFEKENLKGASYTFTLGSKIRIPKIGVTTSVDTKAPSDEHEMDSTGFILEPGKFILGVTRESLALNGKFGCFLSVRGSCAQIGLNALLSSSFAEPDTDNPQILEIQNASQNPIRLYTRMKIVKGIFMRIE